MARPRVFDHDGAYARWLSGESQAVIARSYGVSAAAVSQLVARRQMNHRRIQWARDRYRRPCVRGCGRLAWHGPSRDRTGVCKDCEVAERQAAAEAQDNHGTETRYSRGCRCDACRGAARDAKRERRERTRVPCSHGCGTLVNSHNRRNPDKPPECRPCAMRRIHDTRRAAA